jgi:chemotaxis protein MotB
MRKPVLLFNAGSKCREFPFHIDYLQNSSLKESINYLTKKIEKMKSIKYIALFGLSTLMVSCVTNKKYEALNAKYQRTQESDKSCEDQLNSIKAMNSDLENKNKSLTDQVEYLKKSSDQVLNTLQDMSVLSGKQAESMKQSMKTLSEREAYIKDLQSAIQRKDSLNLNLVLNLKKSLGNVNDEDINIKVEKGVVYIDISDKLLFNSGKYVVTEKAKTVLGKIANVLNAHPELDVMVEGHTDSIPIHNTILADNWDLSVKRATSVVRILQEKYKISPIRMTAAGHGKYDPVAANNTAEGRALNRRTRIVVLPQLDQFFKLLVKN